MARGLSVPCCAMLCPSSAETGETWWNTDLGERVQYLLAFHFHLGGGFPLKTRFDKTILSRLAPAQTLAKPRVADEFLTSREYDPYLVVLTCLICSQTDCQICRTMRTSPFFMLELQTLSGLRGIIGIYILRNIIYYMINWEPKRQKKKARDGRAGHDSIVVLWKFCQAQKLKHYPLVLVVVLSLVPGALGCPDFVVKWAFNASFDKNEICLYPILFRWTRINGFHKCTA